MSRSTIPRTPIEVPTHSAAAPARPGTPSPTPPTSHHAVAVIVVTWNRKLDLAKALAGLAAQSYPPSRLHVIVVDNASTDGTQDLVAHQWRPETAVENATDRADRCRFEPLPIPPTNPPNAGGFASLTLVRNHANMGGCGGFNTGLTYVAHAFAPAAPHPPPQPPGQPIGFVWLVDDDAIVAPNALENLLRAADSDPAIGLVGSRTVDIADRKTTIESTIYLNRAIGVMGDEPPPGHPRRDDHLAWIAKIGGTRGDRHFTGLRDTDVVSACSLLARWSAVQRVGFWDARFFIYCDDADWCLRFGRAGFRVVLNLDALVYHTPWNLKLTVARIYYAQRNLLWMIQKDLTGAPLKRVMWRRLRAILRDSLRAAFHRRLFHADIIRRTALDVVTNRGGRLESDGPEPQPITDALRAARQLSPRSRVAFLCSAPQSVAWADAFRAHVRASLAPGDLEPRWLYILRNDAPDHATAAEPPSTRPDRIIYSSRRRSRLRRQLSVLRRRPSAVVVFDQTTDFPCIAGTWNLHVDMRRPTECQLERDGPLRRLAFLARWSTAALRCAAFSLTCRTYTSHSRYG